MKAGAVRDPDTQNVAIVFEFSSEEFKRIGAAAPLKQKKVLSRMFTKNVGPKRLLKALALAVKTVRREV